MLCFILPCVAQYKVLSSAVLIDWLFRPTKNLIQKMWNSMNTTLTLEVNVSHEFNYTIHHEEVIILKFVLY